MPLPKLARATTVPQLAAFLMDPLKIRPSGRMPSLNLTQAEATAIAMYLLRDQANGKEGKAAQWVQGVSFEYFEGEFDASSNFNGLTPASSGVADHFTIASHKRAENFGFRFTGSIEIPATGLYTFYSESDDGSRIAIDGTVVVDSWSVHSANEKRGTATLSSGAHAIEVTYFDGGGESVLKVSWKGPGIAKQEIPENVLSHTGQGMNPLDEEIFVPDATKAARGKGLFVTLHCGACHDDGTGMHSVALKSLASLNTKRGCLDENVPASLPDYHLDESQRTALVSTLSNRGHWSEFLNPGAQVTQTIMRLNCLACHTRDGKGGPTDVRLAYFKVLGEADLGDEGRIPPHLTKVGAKLKPEWLVRVLSGKGSVRPYMATRMPDFGEANVRLLADIFEKADFSESAGASTELSERDAKFGRRLVGTGGLSCISCHTFAGHKSLGIPAIDLTTMFGRLHEGWFERYVVDPPALRPGTRMPSFWPEGKAVNQDVLGGNAKKQIEAIWAYLSKGTNADLPPGLVQGKIELVAQKEPIVYRNFIKGAGSRAIGVGYPEHANLAFDANDVRLALIWQGSFMDASRHRTGRGEGYEPPLGDRVLSLPSGPAFAVLSDLQQPWPGDVGKVGGFQMRGYQLDAERRPAFHYTWKGAEINDAPIPVAGELDSFFKRIITISGSVPPHSWFRAATGTKIELKSDGYSIDGRLTLKIVSSENPLVREMGGQTELLVPIVLKDGNVRIVEELIW